MYYVVWVSTGKEEETIEYIKSKIDSSIVLDAFSPKRKKLRKFKGSWHEVTERYFPGYLIVESNNPKELFVALYNIPGFTKMLGKSQLGDTFTPLSEGESMMIDRLANKNQDRITEISDIKIGEGKTIIVLDGPLAGLEGSVKKVNLHKREVYVEIEMVGRKITVPLSVNIVMEK